jgi:hypothetical protein
MLRVWFAAVAGATLGDLKHIVFFVGEPVPDWVQKQYGLDPRFVLVPCPGDEPGLLSIGHYHNLGAKLASTEWIMKMDIDTLPNVRYFSELIRLLKQAGDKEWFNGGMVYVCQASSERFLTEANMPLLEETYQLIMHNLRAHCGHLNTGPAATNFICRREQYLSLGGCDDRFRGYGWEDYQQLYMLETAYRGRDALPGMVHGANVTKRCCAEISRIAARALAARDPWLVLLHRYHTGPVEGVYRSPAGMEANKRILLDYILQRKNNGS